MANKFRISKLGYLLIGIALCAIAAPLIFMAVKKLEGEPPVFKWDAPIHPIGASCTLNGVASDQKSGLKRVWIAILQQGREQVLYDKRFPSEGFFTGNPVRKQPVSLEINVHDLGLRAGEAVLRTAVWDHSYRRRWSGNRFYAERKVLIDTQPPDVEVLTRNHNLSQGGAGLILYKITEPVTNSGVLVANRFFPGSSGYFDDPNVFLAFFAIPYDEGPEVQLYVTATDLAGNTSRTVFPHYINPKAFKNDVINVTDSFLKRTMAELEKVLAKGGHSSASPLEAFLAVNRGERQANFKTIKDVCKNSDARLYWTGRFLRLPGSARKAAFGDHRTYQHKGKTIDNQVHLGIDLASFAQSAVPAANNGRVAFAENLGIYGNTIIIDHGFGLFSMYGHLSHIQASTGQMVSKGDIIGSTGSTGLAAGDHLHLSILIHNTFVNPVEWWDPTWIKHNITGKLDEITKELERLRK